MKTHVFSMNDNSIISKKGTVMNNENGEAYLFNKKGEFFLLDYRKVSIWNMCIGIPFTRLLEEVLRLTKGNVDEVRQRLVELIRYFQNISIVEIKELN